MRRGLVLGAVTRISALWVLLLCLAPAVHAQWQISSENGKSSIKFGFLAQGRLEALDTADGEHSSQNLFFRRLRLLAGGKLNDQLSFFMETDSPNLGKGGATGKDKGDIYIQDFVLTYKHSAALSVDAGMLLVENSHNSNQSAASLMATDYGNYSFVNSGPIDARVGRDYGVRLRGYLANNKLEYRAGVYQGVRGTDSTNPFRLAGRLVYNVFEAETGYYYSGTNLGKKKILSCGVSYDTQSTYDATGVDFYLDMPTSGGNGFTLQGDWIQFDGGTFLASLPKQDAYLGEIGYYFAKSKLLPFFQYSSRDFDAPTSADEDKLQFGIGYMFGGHNQNLKLSYAQISKDWAPDRNEIWLNLQVFTF